MTPRPTGTGISRRRCLAAIGAVAFASSTPAQHASLGPVVPPVPAPNLDLLLHDGHVAALPQLLAGHVTALQLMFTGCSATCPIQGAIFAALARELGVKLPHARLLSISVDPLADDAAALSAWRRKFGATDAWIAAAPPVRHVNVMRDFAAGAPVPRGERHNTQTFLFDPQGRLAYRCAELSSAPSIAQAMLELALRSGAA